MNAYLVDQRRFNALVLVMTVVAYLVALEDQSDGAWLPLLLCVVGFGLRVIEPRIPAWTVLALTITMVIAINVNELRAEGGFFLVCMAAFATTAERRKLFPDSLLVIAGVLAPVPVAMTDLPVGAWQWPFWSMGTLVSGFFGSVLLHQRRLTTELGEAQEQLAQQAAGEERRRIAREVHDLVGHSLTVVLLHVTGARRLVHRNPDEAERALEDAERAGRGALADIRRTVALLREEGDARTPTPTGQDLATLIADSRAAGMDISATIDGLENLDETTGLATYRIVQEALANAARHAPGASTEVRVDRGDNEIEIDVINGGSISSPSAPADPGTGLIGMQERAVALGGSVVAGPHAAGWRVRATLPTQVRADA